MYASIFNCSTAFLAWEILVVLFDTSSFILFFLEETKLRPFEVRVANTAVTERTVIWALTNPRPPHQHCQAVGHKYKADTIYFCSLAPWHLIALHICILQRQHSSWILQTTYKCRAYDHDFSVKMVALVHVANAEQLFTNRPCRHRTVWLRAPVTPRNIKTSSEMCAVEMNATPLSPSIREKF